MNLTKIKEALLRKEQDYDSIKSLKITEGALKKARVYAENIKPVLGKDLECYGYLITPKQFNDGIVRDVFLASQEADAVSVNLDIDDIIKAGKFLQDKGFKILGWWHSHNTMDTFHSGTDDENLFTILDEIAPTNFVEVKNEKEMFTKKVQTKVIEDKVIVTDNEKDVEMVMVYGGNIKDKVKVVSSVLKAPIKVGYAYSLVVNSIGQEPHTEVAIKEFCPLYLREKDEEKIKIPLEIVKTKKDVIINENRIREEIKEKVNEVSVFGWSSKYIGRIPFPQDLKNGQKVYTKGEVEMLLNQQKIKMEQEYRTIIQRILKICGVPIKWIGGLFKGEEHDYPDDMIEDFQKPKRKMKDFLKNKRTR